MINCAALVKAVLDVITASRVRYGEKGGHPMRFCSLPAGLHQQATDTLVSLLDAAAF